MLSKGIKRYQVEKCIRGRICNVVYRFVKANNKYIKDYDKNKESSYLKYWDVNNLYGWAMSQKLPLYDFMRVEKTSQFNELHNDLHFLPEKKMKIEKIEKLVANLHDKEDWLNFQLGQKAWLKSYIDMNTELAKNAENYFEKYFFGLVNNAAFGKTMENLRKHRYIKLVTTEARRNYLVSERNYDTTKYFSENL